MSITAIPTLQIPAEGPFVKLNVFGLDDGGRAVDLPVLRCDGNEGMSQLYEFEIEFLSEHLAVPEERLTAREAWLTFYRDGAVQRYVHGVIETARRTRRGAGLRPYVIRLVPRMKLLTRNRYSRIFEGLTVNQIIDAVLHETGVVTRDTYEFTCQDDSLIKLQREYCVQYRESDYDFIARLLAEENMFFYFVHGAPEGDGPAKHTIRFCNGARYLELPAPAELQVETPVQAGHAPTEDAISRIEHEANVTVEKAVLRDYNFRNVRGNDVETLSMFSESSDLDDRNFGPQPRLHLEHYDYPARFSWGTGNEAQQHQARQTRLAAARGGALNRDARQVHGTSNCLRMAPGYYFTVARDPVTYLQNIKYVITRLRCAVVQPQVAEQHAHLYGDKTVFRNEFTGMQYHWVFHPPFVPPKPRIYGMQTAIVIGPRDEEIYTDEYGRIKALFHWSRYHHEEHPGNYYSCWMRVSQSWAGMGWGSVVIPRVGQEVIVGFLEGDPDQPLVLGCVYNGTHRPPHALPEHKTRSAFKTNSSPGGGGFNELRFEDKKDEEQIYLHAQKDLDEVVRGNHRESVGNDRHLNVRRDDVRKVERDAHDAVERDRIAEIKRDASLKVGGKQMIEVTGSRTLAVGGDTHHAFSGNFSQEVGGDLYLKAMGVVIEGMKELTLKVGGNFVKIDSSGITLVGTQIKLNSGGSAGNGRLVGAVPALVPLQAAAAVANAGDADPGDTRETHSEQSGDAENKSWIEVAVVDEADRPLPGEQYEVELPNGRVATGTTGADGVARIEGVDPGTCKIRFPNLDKDAWERA
jgi:type VI secretion system secreted protein VgrG